MRPPLLLLIEPVLRSAFYRPNARQIRKVRALSSPIPQSHTCVRCRVQLQLRPYSDHRGDPPKAQPALESDGQRNEKDSRPSDQPDSSSTPDDSPLLLHDADLLADLPSQAERRRGQISKRFTYLMDDVQSKIFLASQRLNDLTGYSGIEALKKTIEAHEIQAKAARAAVRAAKEAYTSAIGRRSASQREVNELLQRKNGWSAADLERFTALYRSDHANEQAEAAAADAMAAAERAAEEVATQLSRSILARYHEEQIWSDKIRRMSTWGTWGLMGVNVLLFVVFQIAVEPWRRKRLVLGFEEKVKEALERERVLGDDGGGHTLAEGAAPTVAVSDDLQSSDGQTQPPPSPLGTESEAEAPQAGLPASRASSAAEAWRNAVQDLFSERHVSLRKLDVTTIALEAAATGAACVGVVCFVLLKRA